MEIRIGFLATICVFCLVFGASIATYYGPPPETITITEPSVNGDVLDVQFSDQGNCEDIINQWFLSSNSSIDIMIYSFTLDSLSQTLIQEHASGTIIRVLFEKQQVTVHSEYSSLLSAGIPVRNDSNSKLMHHKVVIIDHLYVITGSFNFSANAQNFNDENLIVIKSPSIALLYQEEFNRVWEEGI